VWAWACPCALGASSAQTGTRRFSRSTHDEARSPWCVIHTVLILCSYCAHAVLILCSYCTHTVLILCSYCTHTVLILCSYCAHTVLILRSYCAHTVLVSTCPLPTTHVHLPLHIITHRCTGQRGSLPLHKVW
jgi:hypothetical protein